MTTAIIFHEVQDGAVWANAWKKGPGSRHEMFGKLGITCRNFRDSKNPNATGLIAEIPDMAKFQVSIDAGCMVEGIEHHQGHGEGIAD